MTAAQRATINDYIHAVGDDLVVLNPALLDALLAALGQVDALTVALAKIEGLEVRVKELEDRVDSNFLVQPSQRVAKQ